MVLQTVATEQLAFSSDTLRCICSPWFRSTRNNSRVSQHSVKSCQRYHQTGQYDGATMIKRGGNDSNAVNMLLPY